MKAVSLMVLALFAAGALAQSGMHGDHMKGADARSAAQAHKASGTVTRVDAGKGTVTIAHGPVASLNWPAMTMGFKARDKQVLEQAKPGAKVEFDFVQQGKDYVITRMK